MATNSKITRQVTSNIEEKILCAYQNLSGNWQIAKITNIPHYYWEKVVLPGQKIVFQTSAKAKLAIFSAENITTILVDTIPCQKLKLN